MTTTLPPLASGPHPLEQRRLTIDEGTIAVVLRDGKVWGVRGSGRSGPARGMFGLGESLPLTGSLSYLLFENAPFTVDMDFPDLRLNDGRRIGVSSTVRARPIWMDQPRLLENLAREYGIRSASSYTAAATAQLEADFRAHVQARLAEMGHQQILTSTDGRETLGRDSTASDLLVIENLNTTFTRDGTEIELEQIAREAEVERARVSVEQELQGVRHVLERLRAQHASELDQITRIGIAETDRVVAQVYGVHPWRYRNPEFAQQLDLARIESLRGLLTEYADTIPFLAQTLDRSPAELMTALMRNEVPEPGPRAVAAGTTVAHGDLARAADGSGGEPARWPMSARVAEALPFAPELSEVTGCASVTVTVGDETCLLVAAVAPGVTPAALPLDAPYWRSQGFTQVNLCIVPDGEPAEVAQTLAELAGDSCGLRIADVRRAGQGTERELRLTLGAVPADVDPARLGGLFAGWKDAIEALLADIGHPITIALVNPDSADG